MNSETDETALVNNDSTTGAKINSIDVSKTLTSFSNNTWGVKVGTSVNFSPIPKLTSPMNAVQTTGKTNGSEMNSIKIGMKLGDNLESGRYANKLIFSILTNNYDHIAIMTEGSDFNKKLKALETATNKIEHFKKSTVAPAASMNAVNIDDEVSDYEIKLWLDPADKTAYYYTEPEKVYLNEDMKSMFRNMSSLTTLDLSDFDTSQVTNMSYMFFNTSSLTLLDLSNFDTSQVMNMDSMFRGMTNLTTIDLSNFDTSKVEDMSSMFSDMRNLTTLNLSNFNTSRVAYMNRMFSDMHNLINLNISNFDTSQVTDMNDMFSNIRNLTNLNLSNFNTSKVTDMGVMFYGMSSLTTLDLSSFDTSNVTKMYSMFRGISNLTTLNLSNFNTSKVMSMEFMFCDMRSLTILNLSNFDTSNVTNMNSMFYGMRSLTTLDLSNFDTSNVKNMSYMFFLSYDDIPKDKLERIYVNNDFNTAKLTGITGMFGNRKKLRGGNGSFLTNPNIANKTWLRVDRPGVQGYFTKKT